MGKWGNGKIQGPPPTFHLIGKVGRREGGISHRLESGKTRSWAARVHSSKREWAWIWAPCQFIPNQSDQARDEPTHEHKCGTDRLNC
jgi:hypothetical protein